MIAALLALLLVFPLTCRGVLAGMDTVFCCGICCRVAGASAEDKPASGGTEMSPTGSSR